MIKKEIKHAIQKKKKKNEIKKSENGDVLQIQTIT